MGSKLDEWEKTCESAIAEATRAESLRKQLSKNCKHPARFVVDISTEHDDGYGKQTRLKGVKCGICFAHNFYGTWIKN